MKKCKGIARRITAEIRLRSDQIRQSRTLHVRKMLDEIFKSNLRVLRGEYAMGNLREPNAKGDRDIQSFQECCSDVWVLHKV